MKLWLLIVAGSAILLPSAAQETTGAQQLTVELFAARNLQEVTLAPLGAHSSMRTCATCATTTVRVPLHLTLQNGEVRSSTGLHASVFKLEGGFRLQAGNAIAETAANDVVAEATGEWQIRPSGKGPAGIAHHSQ